MFRQSLMGYKFLILTKCIDNIHINLFDTDIAKFNTNKISVFNIVEARRFIIPCFVHFDVFNLLLTISNFCSENRVNDVEQMILVSKDYFKLFNYSWFIIGGENRLDCIDINCKTIPSLEENMCNKVYISVNDKNEDGEGKNTTAKKPRIAIANLKVPEDSITKMSKGDISFEPKVICQLTGVINDAIKEKCDMLILPEVSVPFNWLPVLVSQCIRNDMAVVAGLTHFAPNNVALNVVVTLLPVNLSGYTTCFVSGRVKNHYSPHEDKAIKSYGYKVPEIKPSSYFHYHWRQLYFTVYNCFELASIEDRSLFKSEVDLVIATEWNQDTHYYSDIVGSWVRDLHCYVAQVNTSHYGDSRIMQPSKSVMRDMVIVKGGKNSTILVEDLDVKALRDFQLKGHNLQMDDDTFKLTPPNFNTEEVLKRMLDEEMFSTD